MAIRGRISTILSSAFFRRRLRQRRPLHLRVRIVEVFDHLLHSRCERVHVARRVSGCRNRLSGNELNSSRTDVERIHPQDFVGPPLQGGLLANQENGRLYYHGDSLVENADANLADRRR